jgi:peptidoglycan/LPS O-acetylase OafA/YrhL
MSRETAAPASVIASHFKSYFASNFPNFSIQNQIGMICAILTIHIAGFLKTGSFMPIATAVQTKTDQAETYPPRQIASAIKAASPASVHLDALRGMAALAVFVEHWRYLFFANYPQLQHPSILTKIFYALTGLGHSSVMVFFVLSGFFISSSIFRSQEQSRWSWTWYAEQRLTRLYVVLLPALILGAVWDIAGSHLFRNTPIYLAFPDYQLMIKHPISQMLAAGTWFGNLFFLQGIRTPIFGSNGPLWSLNYEFWYYVLFPIGLFALARKIKIAARIGYLLACLLLLAFIGKVIALYFLIWLLGAFVGFFRASWLTKNKATGLLFGLLFVISLLAPRFKLIPNGMLSDWLVAVTFSAVLYFLLNYAHQAPGLLYAKAARSLSNISYSLYLIHVPVLVFLNACIIRHGSRWQPTLGHLAQGILIAGLVFLYTYGIWSLTEARTSQVRAAIQRLFSKNRQTA